MLASDFTAVFDVTAAFDVLALAASLQCAVHEDLVVSVLLLFDVPAAVGVPRVLDVAVIPGDIAVSNVPVVAEA
jgi:hypothetical protein